MEINVHELSDKQLDELALKIRKGIQKDRENEKKQFKKRAFHNTRLLMREYHKLKAHNEVVKEHIEAVQGTFWEHRWLNLDILMQNKAKTVKIMNQVDRALDHYERDCLKAVTLNESRRYDIIKMKYLNKEHSTDEDIADRYDIDRRTAQRNIENAVDDVSIILFGIEAFING